MTSKNSQQVRPETVDLWGGTLCLDFANSVDWSDVDEPLSSRTDALAVNNALTRWGRRLGLVPAGRALDADDAELAAAAALRESVHQIFAAIARRHRPPAPALRRLEETYAASAAIGRLAHREGGWLLDWPPGDARRVRFAVAMDAVGLLSDPRRLARVKRCPGRDCGWLFLDAGGRRRWCSMETCGSRAKMRRLYDRRRAK